MTRPLASSTTSSQQHGKLTEPELARRRPHWLFDYSSLSRGCSSGGVFVYGLAPGRMDAVTQYPTSPSAAVELDACSEQQAVYLWRAYSSAIPM